MKNFEFNKVYKITNSNCDNIKKGDKVFFLSDEEFTYFNILIHRDKSSFIIYLDTAKEFATIVANLTVSRKEDKNDIFEEIRFCFDLL